MNVLIGLAFLAAAALLMRWMERTWGKSGKYVELMRFAGNEAAKRGYENLRDVGGHAARPSRPQRIHPDPVQLSQWLDDGGAVN
jgi:ABC-type sugar transport system substrate-binding protein